MSKRQFALLFACNVIPYATGSGILALFPVYARALGFDSGLIGLAIAVAFASLAVSTIFAGWLSDRLQRRTTLMIAGALLSAIGFLVLGQVSTLVGVIGALALVWFGSGFVSPMINVLTGLFAPNSERGRIFGLLGISLPVGLVISGLSGVIVDHWGYAELFVIDAIAYAAIPVMALLVQDKVVERSQTTGSAASRPFANPTFLFLFIASAVAFMANSELPLARSLLMDSLDFPATAISTTVSIGALVSLPLPAIVGVLSDRLGRKPFMIVCYLTTGVSLIILIVATELWHFWAAAALQMLLNSSLVAGSALVTDMFPQRALGKALALFTSTPWVGFIVGYGGGGWAMRALGITTALMIGVALSLIASALLVPIQSPQTALQAEGL